MTEVLARPDLVRRAGCCRGSSSQPELAVALPVFTSIPVSHRPLVGFASAQSAASFVRKLTRRLQEQLVDLATYGEFSRIKAGV